MQVLLSLAWTFFFSKSLGKREISTAEPRPSPFAYKHRIAPTVRRRQLPSGERIRRRCRRSWGNPQGSHRRSAAASVRRPTSAPRRQGLSEPRGICPRNGTDRKTAAAGRDFSRAHTAAAAVRGTSALEFAINMQRRSEEEEEGALLFWEWNGGTDRGRGRTPILSSPRHRPIRISKCA